MKKNIEGLHLNTKLTSLTVIHSASLPWQLTLQLMISYLFPEENNILYKHPWKPLYYSRKKNKWTFYDAKKQVLCIRQGEQEQEMLVSGLWSHYREPFISDHKNVFLVEFCVHYSPVDKLSCQTRESKFLEYCLIPLFGNLLVFTVECPFNLQPALLRDLSSGSEKNIVITRDTTELS